MKWAIGCPILDRSSAIVTSPYWEATIRLFDDLTVNTNSSHINQSNVVYIGFILFYLFNFNKANLNSNSWLVYIRRICCVDDQAIK
jgi:hypothetical protein